jgi:hypothetical protein
MYEPMPLNSARFAQLAVDADRHVRERDVLLARLDERLERVGEAGEHGQAERRLAAVGAETRGRIGDVGLRQTAHDRAAESLQPLLERREVLDLVDLTCAHDHVGAAREDRFDEARDVGTPVLIVAHPC